MHTEVWCNRWPRSQRIFWDIVEEYLEVTGRRKHGKGLEDSISSRLLTWSIIGFALSGISISYLTVLTKRMHLTRPGRKYALMTKCALIRKVCLTTRVYGIRKQYTHIFGLAVTNHRLPTPCTYVSSTYPIPLCVDYHPVDSCIPSLHTMHCCQLLLDVIKWEYSSVTAVIWGHWPLDIMWFFTVYFVTLCDPQVTHCGFLTSSPSSPIFCNTWHCEHALQKEPGDEVSGFPAGELLHMYNTTCYCVM